MLLRLGTAAAALALAACGDDGAAPVDADGPCVVGDLAAAPELELVSLDDAFAQRPLADGDELALVTPPQGGKVVFVGMRIKNVDLCGATIQAALRDPCTGRVVGIERRPVRWRVAPDGLAEPLDPQAISDYTNVAACPNAALSRDVDGSPYQLEVRFYPPGGAPAIERILEVTPRCAADDEQCRCECDSEYRLGEACPIDPEPGGDACPDARG